MKQQIKVAKLVLVWLVAAWTTPAQAEQTIIDMLPDGSPAINPVQLRFEGSRYDVPIIISESRRSSLDPYQEFLLDFISASAAGDHSKLISLWRPEDQANIAETLSKPDLAARTGEYYRLINASRLMLTIKYGIYTIALVHHSHQQLGDPVLSYTMMAVGDQIYASNALSADPVFVFFAQKYARQLQNQIIQSPAGRP